MVVLDLSTSGYQTYSGLEFGAWDHVTFLDTAYISSFAGRDQAADDPQYEALSGLVCEG